MHRLLLFLLMASLVLAAVSVGVNGVQGLTSDVYSLQLQGFVWNHTTLKVLLVSADNESWWSSVALNTAVRVIGQWNEAFSAFSSNYSDFSYLLA